MSKSLIRKNQLHPDISDLVRDYGSAFFLDAENLVTTGTILQTQINNLGNIYATKINGQFSNRPTVNGTGILLSGEIAGNADWNATTGGAQILNKPVLNGVVTNAFPSGFGNGIATINWAAASHWSGGLGMTGGTTIQFQNVIVGKTITLDIGNASGYLLAWPAGITWVGGSAPSTTAIRVRILATSATTFLGYVDTRLASSASYTDLVDKPSTLTGKTLYVDAGVGTDTRTGLSKYDIIKPFLTIAAAVAASVTGDLVYVRAGTYTITSQINLDGKGNMFFETGATVQVSSGVVAFSFSQTALPINAISIRGNADFQLLGTTAGVLTMPSGNATTAVQFECNSISGPNSVTGTLFNCAIGALSVDAKLIQMTTNFAASNATVFNITGFGIVTARVPFVYCGVFLNGAGAANVGNSAPARFNADVWTLITFNTTAGMNLSLITTSFRIVNYTHIGVGAALSWTENTTLESHTFRGFTWVSSPAGQPHITFASSAGSTTLKIIKLDETNTMRYASTNSLSSNVPINVSTHSTFAAVSATANITFKIGSFTVDPEVNNF